MINKLRQLSTYHVEMLTTINLAVTINNNNNEYGDNTKDRDIRGMFIYN